MSDTTQTHEGDAKMHWFWTHKAVIKLAKDEIELDRSEALRGDPEYDRQWETMTQLQQHELINRVLDDLQIPRELYYGFMNKNPEMMKRIAGYDDKNTD